MKPPANPVTVEDAAKFAGYITTWQQKLNLLDWRVIKSSKRPKGVMAQVTVDTVAKMATYGIGPNFGVDTVDDYTLESTACHEMLHVLVVDLVEAAKANASADILMGMEHRIVHTLERLLVPKP